jgi:hypothetical protein
MDDGRLERIERRMEDLDRRESALERAMDSAMTKSRAAVGAVVPDEARSHMRASWRHNLLAVRSMIDHWAEQLNDGRDDHSGDAGADSANQGRENIPID